MITNNKINKITRNFYSFSLFSYLFQLFILFSLFSYSLSITPPSSFTIGISSMMRIKSTISQNKKYLAAIMMAVDEINNKNDGILDDLLPATTFKFYFREDVNDFTLATLNAYFNLIYAPTTVAAIGPITTISGQGTIPVYEASKVPVIGFHDRSPYFSDSLIYPNYLRTVPGSYQDGQATASLIAQYFQWDKVIVFATNTQVGRTSAQVFRHYADKYNIQILSSFTLDSSGKNLITSINDAKKFGSRIFVLFTEVDIAFDLIEKGNEMKLFSSQTQIIGGELLSNERSWNSLNTTSLQLNKLLKGFISVKYNKEIPSSDLKEAFISRWLALPNTNGSNTVPPVCNPRKDSFNSGYIYQFNPASGDGSPIPGYSAVLTGTCSGVDFSSYKSLPNLEHELDDVMYAYDSVLAVAYGLHHLIYDQNILPTASILNDLLHNFSFTGITGEVSFNTAMKDESFDVGGRIKDIRYDIVNYIPIENADTLDRNITFQSIIQWHSENGFTDCLTESYINPSIDLICNKFQYSTVDNSLPLDSPPPKIHDMPESSSNTLIVLATLGLCCSTFVLLVKSCYRNKILVKMSQPMIARFKRLGFMLGFLRVILSAVETKYQICYGRLWLEHIAFQLIFSAILVRSARVYLVTSTMKKVKVTDMQCILFILISIIITSAILISISVDGVHIKEVVTEENQFNYTLEKTCQYKNQNLLLLMYLYDLFILSLAIIICWFIRKVNSTISNTRALVECLITTTIAIIGLTILISVSNLTPVTLQFVIGLVISLVIIRFLWVFESKMIYQLFAGYELDRSLILHKSEKNILQLIGLNQLSNKIFVSDDQDSGAVSPNAISRINARKASIQQSEAIKKYSKLSLTELVATLNLIKSDLELKQMEQSSLENLIFLASQDNLSSNSHSSSRDHQSNQSESNREHNQFDDPKNIGCDESARSIEKNEIEATEMSQRQKNQMTMTNFSNDKNI